MKNVSKYGEPIDNGSYQRHLATLLLENSSISDAAQYCQKYGLEGVLQFILSRDGLSVECKKNKPHFHQS